MPGKIRPYKPERDGHEDASRLAAQALQLVRLADLWSRSPKGEFHLKSIALYPPSASRNGMWLVIGKGWAGGYRVVAFHRSTNLLGALLGFLQRCADQKLEWKRDSYSEE